MLESPVVPLENEWDETRQLVAFAELNHKLAFLRWRLATHGRIDEQSRPLLGQCARRAELLAGEIREALAPKPAPAIAEALANAERWQERNALEAKLDNESRSAEPEPPPAARKWGWAPLIGWFRSKAA